MNGTKSKETKAKDLRNVPINYIKIRLQVSQINTRQGCPVNIQTGHNSNRLSMTSLQKI